jgi:biopolymer transport protein ExbD
MNAREDGTFDSRVKEARVEIIPLIDVVFFLLATFVLFTLSLNRVKVLEAELPAGELEGATNDETTAFIQASVDGTFYWRIGTAGETERITAAELGPRLQTYKRSYTVPRVLLRSDGDAKLRAAVIVLDEVHRAEIKNVAIETRATKTGS